MATRVPRPRRTEVYMRVIDPAKLRRARKRAGYTQDELARLARMAQQYVSMLETGADKDCSEQIAERICKYLDIDLGDYFAPISTSRVSTVTTPSRGTGKSLPRAVSA